MPKVFSWLKQRKRLRIGFWAILLGAICGLIQFGQPAEDGLRAVRNVLFQRQADQSMVVLAIDEHTINSLKSASPARSDDAKVVDRVFALGAKRLFFDKAFSEQTSEAEDARLRDAFKRHQGRVFLGAGPPEVGSRGEGIWPLPMYQQVSTIRNMAGESAPFGLSARFPLFSKGPGRNLPSISTELARVKAVKDKTYRPDFSIDTSTIPTVSYVDLLRGHEKLSLQGRDVIVGPTAEILHDRHWIPFHGMVPGVYSHVVGAQTLKEGLPLDVEWFPAFVLAVCALAILMLFPAISAFRVVSLGSITTTVFWLLAPFLSVSVDVVPGLLTFVLGGVRLGFDARRRVNAVSGLPTISSLRSAKTLPGDHVFALRISNYASIKASSTKDIEGAFVAELARRITVSEGARVITHDQDALVWTRPALAAEDLRDHSHGLHAMLTKGLDIGGAVVDAAVSIGIDINYAETLASRIDGAMQCAEDAVIATHVCKVGQRSTATERAWNVQILSQLERAMTNGELWVAYQPKVALRTGEITGVEALIRWTHPERGLIGPGEFIPIAERHNRMEPLTSFVIDQALHTLSIINTVRPGFKMAVNISTQLLWSDRVPEMLDRAVKKHKVNPKQVVLEITETAQVATSKEALAVMAKLKARGFQISIDDFGTGNATIEYLALIPADEVKIDRLFIAELELDQKTKGLAHSVVELALRTRKRVVAEGIETAPVARLLKKMGCEEGQGFFFDKAMSAADLFMRLEPTKLPLTA